MNTNFIFRWVMALVAIFLISLPVMAQDTLGENPLDGEVYESRDGHEYDATWDGWTLEQKSLPEPEDREAHSVDVVIPGEEMMVFDAVSCFGRTPNGRIFARENGAVFYFNVDTTVEIRCDGTETTGFKIAHVEIADADVVNSANPMANWEYESPQGEDYNPTWGGNSGFWLYQPSLPETRIAHEVVVAFIPGQYRFNGQICRLKAGEVVYTADNGDPVEFDNGIIFSIPEGNEIVSLKVTCNAGPTSGFSVETVEEPTEAPDTTDWDFFNFILENTDGEPIDLLELMDEYVESLE